jgi:hypothetical protein
VFCWQRLMVDLATFFPTSNQNLSLMLSGTATASHTKRCQFPSTLSSYWSTNCI